MADTRNDETFEAIVEWACSTLPQKIKDLPDFPGIQVVDEPPADVFARISKKRKWPRGTQLLGLYSGIPRTEQRNTLLRIAPDLIFVFRGPILRCSKGNLRAEVKEVVWHEVAHWLGHNEAEVEELGLSTRSSGVKDTAPHPLESEAPKIQYAPDQAANEQQPRCIKCYSADVSCGELDKPLTVTGRWLSDPVIAHFKIWRCNSCGYEGDDEDNA